MAGRNQQSKNPYNALIVAGVTFIILACVLFPFMEGDGEEFSLWTGLGITSFLLGILLLCIPSWMAKAKKANSGNQPSSQHGELEPPRRIEIEPDDDRYVSKDVYQSPDEYRAEQERYHHQDEAREKKKKDEHVVCPHCGFINSPGREECILCHKMMVEKCPKCGKKNPAGSEICHHCGANIKKK